MEQKTMEKLVELVRAKEARADALAGQYRDLSGEILANWDEIKQLIIEGGSLGDPLNDFIIVRYGSLSRKIEKRYLEMQEKFGRYQGQYIMIVKMEKVPLIHRLFPEHRTSDYAKVPNLKVGVLKGDKFIFNLPKGEFFFPTGGRYIFFSGHKVHIQGEDITLDSLEDFGLGTSPDSDIQIFIGDREVINWFNDQVRRDYWNMFCELNLIFQRSITFPLLEVYINAKQTDLSEDYKILVARKNLLEAEQGKSIRIGKKFESQKDKELAEIPGKLMRIIAEAEKLGINIPAK